jgi:hypothetical protein
MESNVPYVTELTGDALDALLDEPTGYGRGTIMDTATRGFRQKYGRKENEHAHGDLQWINGYARAVMDARSNSVPVRPK